MNTVNKVKLLFILAGALLFAPFAYATAPLYDRPITPQGFVSSCPPYPDQTISNGILYSANFFATDGINFTNNAGNTLLNAGDHQTCSTNANLNFESLYGSHGDGYYVYAIELYDSGVTQQVDEYRRLNGVWENVFLSVTGSTTSILHSQIISTTPVSGSTVATTSSIGADVAILPSDIKGTGVLHVHFVQPSLSACQNSGVVYDAVVTCAGSNYPSSGFDEDFTATPDLLVTGIYNLAKTITFPQGGRWNATYEIQDRDTSFFIFHSTRVVTATSTTFIVGQPLPMDVVQGQVVSNLDRINKQFQSGIGAIFASTTASLGNACNPIGSGFNVGDCLALMVWPGDQGLSDDWTIIKNTPPIGYAFRLYDILSATTSTTTLPSISYTFAPSNPMSVMGEIHFDPFTEIANAGTLVNSMTSDRADHKTVWDIMSPFITIFVYLVLIFQIIHDITGIHSHDKDRKTP